MSTSHAGPTFAEIARAIEHQAEMSDRRTGMTGGVVIDLTIGEAVLQQICAGLRVLHDQAVRPADMKAPL
ncbi:hypothetical protein IP86_10710 [Rhodopseudomonas sp. AAP120]|uniref:hypothetical protein n=1 Tax=Rhodopseudomonas sp. AAP120 TaxID=1523430 RepID=UPI0006B98CC4|nr:hypothetical protein [Rhodopseudomonas sp. AAP120]KPF98795.1 hypothetical protein IP86_10710 [Rhodopseudomonas sp. AAP120]